MKIIIDHAGTKREIDGGLHLCMSTDDLLSLCRQLKQELSRRESEGVSYGWMTIYERVPESDAGTRPLSWLSR